MTSHHFGPTTGKKRTKVSNDLRGFLLSELHFKLIHQFFFHIESPTPEPRGAGAHINAQKNFIALPLS
jgi:hypothetical protein